MNTMNPFATLVAARRLRCSPNWVRMLVANELITSCNHEELDAYMEKSPIIHDTEFHDWFASCMLSSYTSGGAA